MPLHVITKASSTTTKFRIVFDASARTDIEVSLNDQFLYLLYFYLFIYLLNFTADYKISMDRAK